MAQIVIAACALLVQSATASAQTAVPVVGLLSSRSEGDSPTVVEDLRKGLQEAGYAEPARVALGHPLARSRGRYSDRPNTRRILVRQLSPGRPMP